MKESQEKNRARPDDCLSFKGKKLKSFFCSNEDFKTISNLAKTLYQSFKLRC